MPESWLVRSAEVADAGELARLAARTFPLACPAWMDPDDIAAHIRTKLSVDAFAIALADAEVRIVVAHPQAAPLAGYLRLELAGSGPREGLLEVRQIYVDPMFHGSGMAVVLMAQAEEQARQMRRSGLWLGTSKENARALAFYRRAGFTIVGERIFQVGQVTNEDWVLAREL